MAARRMKSTGTDGAPATLRADRFGLLQLIQTGQLIDLLGEQKIIFTQPANVVRAQRNHNAVIDIAPVGVMSHFLGEQRDRAHECEGRDEVAEREHGL